MTAKTTKESTNQSSRRNHLIGLLALVILFYYLLIVFTHRFWLPLAADFLILENQPRHADLIVVATPFRPRFLHAINLLQKGYANQILLVGDARLKIPWSGKTSAELAKDEAIKLKIPESKIHVKHSTGTRTDALHTKPLMSSLKLKSALVVSDPYNMRRLGMIFNHVFEESGLKLTLVPTEQKRESPDYWWISPYSFVYVIKEWIKIPMNYYLLNWRPPQKGEPIVVPEDEIEELVKNFTEHKLGMDSLISKDTSHNLFRFIKFKVGELLVVDEKGINLDAVISPVLSSRISLFYQKGSCKKIFLFNGASDYIQNNMKAEKIQAENNKKARELGINPDDVKMIPHTIGDAHQTAHFLNQFMNKNNLKSASLYLPYYETQKFKFYFKRFLNPDFMIQVKPLETSYRHLLEQWIQNTGLGNLYLDQYLIMAHYYFNKFLWSSRT